jgi:hypothetical protein
MTKKIGIIILAIACVLVGLRFGILGALVGASVGGYFLKKYKVISPNSALVSETPGVKRAKYIVLAVVVILLAAMSYFMLR